MQDFYVKHKYLRSTEIINNSFKTPKIEII
jgi:hypothetical protein